MPVPLLSFQMSDNNQEITINPQIFYIFEKSKSILSFKYTNNPNRGPKKCSKILNDAFSKDFELHSDKYTNFGSV